MALGEFWKDYCAEKWNYNDTSIPGGTSYPFDGYIYPRYSYYYPVENKTEQALRILKVLVEEKIIAELDSYKKFCELIEKIAAKI